MPERRQAVLLNVVRIGGSRGIRIPKAILEQCRIGKELEP
jgi:antitoxin component of MazEF toxin-antitoxin module